MMGYVGNLGTQCAASHWKTDPTPPTSPQAISLQEHLNVHQDTRSLGVRHWSPFRGRCPLKHLGMYWTSLTFTGRSGALDRQVSTKSKGKE